MCLTVHFPLHCVLPFVHSVNSRSRPRALFPAQKTCHKSLTNNKGLTAEPRLLFLRVSYRSRTLCCATSTATNFRFKYFHARNTTAYTPNSNSRYGRVKGQHKTMTAQMGNKGIVSGVPRGGLGVQTLPLPRNSEGPPKSCRTQPDCENCYKLLNLGSQHPKMFGKKLVKF